MIRLVCPTMPDLADVARYFRDSQEAGQYSNFGPCWHHAAARIEAMTGMLALPCSSGTMAVALAWAAKSNGELFASYSPFTFEGTRAALIMVEGGGMSSEEWNGTESVVTYPFGYKVPFYAGVVVVDAAGGFCSTIGDVNKHCEDDDTVAIAVSFHATKWFPIGEGGCVLFDKRDRESYDRCRRMMNFGMDGVRVVVESWGTNGKMDELHAAMLLAQLDREETFARLAKDCHADAMRYGSLPGLRLPPYAPNGPLDQSAPSMVTVVAERPAALVHHLSSNKIAAQRGYWPPAGIGAEQVEPAVYGEDEWKGRIVCLPRDTTDAQKDEIAAQIERFARG
jgi:DegT/DnrJ/EryC1/StrS aminotransferase family